MIIQAKTFEEYFEKAGERGVELRVIDKLIRENAAELTPVLFPTAGGVSLGYGIIPYQSSSMKTPKDWPLLALAVQKHHMALYACVIINGKQLVGEYAERLGNVSAGKSCIRFKKVGDLNQKELAKMLEDINARYKRGELLYAQW